MKYKMQHYLFQHEESNVRGLPESNITRLCCTSSIVAPVKFRILTTPFFPDKRCSRIPFMNLVFEGYWPWIVVISKTFSLVLPLLLSLTLFRIDFFGAAHGWRGGGRGGAFWPSSLKSVSHILQWWNLAQIYLT